MLGIALILVGVVLVHNGVLFMSKTKVVTTLDDGTTTETLVPLAKHSPKSIAFFNAIVGGILIFINLLGFALQPLHHPMASGFQFYQNIAAGMIFGVTYLFLAGNLLFKLDMKAFAWFSVGATIFALIIASINFRDFIVNDFDYGIWLGLLWVSWFFLWLTAPLQFLLGIKKMQSIFPWVSIVVGVIGAFLPAILLLTGIWGLLG